MSEHAHHPHAHGALTLQERHAHEAQTYDEMAAQLLDAWRDEEYLVDASVLPVPNREQVDYLADAVSRLGSLAGQRLLEVGVGGGSLATWMALQDADVVGIDVSAGILDVARRRAEVNGVSGRVALRHSAIETFEPAEMGLGEDPFDAIIGNNVVHHFERDLALSRLGSLLAPGASAVFCEPVLFVPEWARRARNSNPVTRFFPPHTHSPDERSLDDGDFATMRRWFATVEWTPHQVLCRLQNFVELSDGVWNRLESIDRRLLAGVPAAARLCRIAVITLADPTPTRPPADREEARA